MKKLLAQEEAMVPNLFYNLRRAFLPLMHDETYEAMDRIAKLVAENGKAPRTESLRGKRDRDVNESREHHKRLNDGTTEASGKKSIESTASEPLQKAGTDSCSGGYGPPCYELC